MATAKKKTHIEAKCALWLARHPGAVVTPAAITTSVLELGTVTTGGIAAGIVTAGIGWYRAPPNRSARPPDHYRTGEAMAQQEKKSKAELAAQSCGMTVEQWQRAKSQNAAARGRGKRPAGTAGADVQLAVWGEVEGQEQLFTGA